MTPTNVPKPALSEAALSEAALPEAELVYPTAPRPYCTYVAFVVALLGALCIEFEVGNAPDMPGATFLIFGPVMVAGYGLDWARLQRPDALQFAWALILSAIAMHVVLYGLVNDWLPTALTTALVGACLVALRWVVASIPIRVREGTFLGRQGELWLFANGEDCWALESKRSFGMVLGCTYAFVAKAKADRPAGGKGKSPYRESPLTYGRLLDVAPSRDVFSERRSENAWRYTCGIAVATVLITVALVLPNLEL